MISVRCPHCRVGLKVDEKKLPHGIQAFKCPKCKEAVPVSLLSERDPSAFEASETALVQAPKTSTGKITILPDLDTREQVFSLYEGVTTIGRQSATSGGASIVGIVTSDKSMSREHIRIEVKKEAKGGYKHYLSDNNSKNHTLYNGSYLGKEEVVVLNDNDEIIIGHTVLRFNE